MSSIRHLSVARIALWTDDGLLVQKDTRLAPEDQFYRLPGGRMDTGEQPQHTALREWAEEIVGSIEFGPLWYITTTRFIRKGREIHETGYVFQGVRHPLVRLYAPREKHLPLHFVPQPQLNRINAQPRTLFLRMAEDGPKGPAVTQYIDCTAHSSEISRQT